MVKHVQRGPGDLARIERRGQRVLVDHLAPAGVDQVAVGSHPAQRGRADQVPGAVGQRHVHGQVVGLAEHLVQVAEPDAERPGDLGTDVRVAGHHLHLQASGPSGEGTGDPAEADQAERAARQPAHRPELGERRPAAALDGPVAGCDPPGAGEQQGQRMLSHVVRAVFGHVGHPDATGPGRRDVDVVVAGAAAGQYPAGIQAIDQAGIEPGVVDEDAE